MYVPVVVARRSSQNLQMHDRRVSFRKEIQIWFYPSPYARSPSISNVS